MTLLAPLLLLFFSGWLLGGLWLGTDGPAAYGALGQPVMGWLWWRWPASAPASGPRHFLQARGRLDVSTLYSVDEVGSIARIALWIVLNRPNLGVSRATRRQQQRLRACATGIVLCLVVVVLLAVLGSG